ncbi:MAG: hypothetical protein ACE5DR_02020 [Thermodesulfobacteriota bacterium]
MKKKLIAFILPLCAFLSISFTCKGSALAGGDAAEELAALKKEFGPVLRLRGTAAAKEINAIANLLTPGSGMMAIDFRHASGEFCMLDPVTKRNMVHFSHEPGNTTEDILYFLDPTAFKAAGLQVKNLPVLPAKLGKMKPFTWYYYAGEAVEPHHGKRLGREFLVMAMDVK